MCAMLSVEDIKSILQKTPVGFKTASDEFFATTNQILIPKYKKLGVIANCTEDEVLKTSEEEETNNNQIYCNVPSCRRYFDCVATYQTHFNSVHRYICAQCKKSLPTPHLLDLHISEHHDSYFAAQVARGDAMFECFLEECKQRLQTPELRKEHCVTVHKFPPNFRFDQLHVKHVGGNKNKSANAMDTSNPGTEMPCKNPEKTTIPKVFSFGHQKARTFHANGQHKSGKVEHVDGATLEDMHSLKQVLEGMS